MQQKKSIRYFVVRCLIKAYLATFSYVSADVWKDGDVNIFIFKLSQSISLLLGQIWSTFICLSVSLYKVFTFIPWLFEKKVITLQQVTCILTNSKTHLITISLGRGPALQSPVIMIDTISHYVTLILISYVIQNRPPMHIKVSCSCQTWN